MRQRLSSSWVKTFKRSSQATLNEPENGLCERCTNLNLSSHLHPKKATEISMGFISEMPQQSLQADRCGLCDIVRTFYLECDPSYGSGNARLSWFRVNYKISQPRILRLRHQNLSALLVPEQIAYRSKSASLDLTTNLGRRLSEIEPDYDLVNEWLTFCREDHQSMCGNNSNGMVPGLKVLDCRTGQLTPADPHSPYVALSYVWGEPTGEHLIRNADTDYMPKTIRDAMKVALRLNFQYLWVDRYCIDQENPDEKRQMIASMGQIYTNAEITIIAVAGTNPEYGLPGVSSTPRRPQYAVKIGHETHVLVMDPLEELNQSKWNSRGWTWQEMLLSRRRLAFSNDQICFQCRDMHCLEALSLQPPKSVAQGVVTPATTLRSLGFNLFPKHGIGREAVEIYSRLEEYCLNRDLSKDEDALNAVSGIFSAYRNSEDLGNFGQGSRFAHHFWGIPILGDEHMSRGSELSSFVAGLNWSSETRSLTSIDRHSDRREGDWPSWSWASLKNQMLQFHVRKKISYQGSISIRVTHHNGSVLDLDAYAQQAEDYTSFHQWLDMSTWTLESHLVDGKFLFPQPTCHTTMLDTGDPIDESVFAVYLGVNAYLTGGPRGENLYVFCFLLCRRDDAFGNYSRIGRWQYSLRWRGNALREHNTAAQVLKWLPGLEHPNYPSTWEFQKLRLV